MSLPFSLFCILTFSSLPGSAYAPSVAPGDKMFSGDFESENPASAVHRSSN